MEQPDLKSIPTWIAGITGNDFTCYDTIPAPRILFKELLWFYFYFSGGIKTREGMSGVVLKWLIGPQSSPIIGFQFEYQFQLSALEDSK